MASACELRHKIKPKLVSVTDRHAIHNYLHNKAIYHAVYVYLSKHLSQKLEWPVCIETIYFLSL